METKPTQEPPQLSEELTELVRSYQELARKCEYCGTTGSRMQIDHIIPKSRGGASTPENLAVACKTCNQRKGASLGWVTRDGRKGASRFTPADYMRLIGEA